MTFTIYTVPDLYVWNLLDVTLAKQVLDIKSFSIQLLFKIQTCFIVLESKHLAQCVMSSPSSKRSKNARPQARRLLKEIHASDRKCCRDKMSKKLIHSDYCRRVEYEQANSKIIRRFWRERERRARSHYFKQKKVTLPAFLFFHGL